MLDEVAIKADNVGKVFKLPHEKHGSLKAAVVNFYRHNKGYEMQKALDGVSFEVKKGEFFGIVGRNGSGKSTLLKLLAGIYTPTKGAVTVNGSLTPFIELGVGFNMELTGRENVFLNGALLGFNRKEVAEMYGEIVEFAELEKFMDQKLKNYSSGMQVRLAFSIAIRSKSDILLLDEVLAVGDAAFQQKCYDYFEELKEQNKTVVLVTHDMGAVRRFCAKAVYIDKGKLTHIGNPEEVADIYIEDNMESTREATKDKNYADLSKKYTVAGKILSQAEDELVLRITYRAQDKKDKMYIGISLQKEGVSIGEITTSLQKPLLGDGKVDFSLNVSLLNGGAYRIGVGLYRLKNREILSIDKNDTQFLIKGSDITKGAALKLADTWKYE